MRRGVSIVHRNSETDDLKKLAVAVDDFQTAVGEAVDFQRRFLAVIEGCQELRGGSDFAHFR